jgi:hypothetical protein
MVSRNVHRRFGAVRKEETMLLEMGGLPPGSLGPVVITNGWGPGKHPGVKLVRLELERVVQKHFQTTEPLRIVFTEDPTRSEVSTPLLTMRLIFVGTPLPEIVRAVSVELAQRAFLMVGGLVVPDEGEEKGTIVVTILYGDVEQPRHYYLETDGLRYHHGS